MKGADKDTVEACKVKNKVVEGTTTPTGSVLWNWMRRQPSLRGWWMGFGGGPDSQTFPGLSWALKRRQRMRRNAMWCGRGSYSLDAVTSWRDVVANLIPWRPEIENGTEKGGRRGAPLPPDGKTDFKEEMGTERAFRTDLVRLASHRYWGI